MVNSSSSKFPPPNSPQPSENPLVSLQTEIDKTINNFSHLLGIPHLAAKDYEELLITPAIDIVEDDKEFKVEVEMPGINENDVKVAIREGMLTISAEKKLSTKDENKNYLRREISYGHYERNIPLPDYLDTNDARASFKKGMLWITIAKKPEFSKPYREVKIEKVDG